MYTVNNTVYPRSFLYLSEDEDNTVMENFHFPYQGVYATCLSCKGSAEEGKPVPPK
jgi:hypothetical protein